MNRAPAALAIAVALSAPRTVRAEPCAPRAELDGDRAAVERVADELHRLGVVIAPATPSCPSVRAMVALDDGGGIAVAVRGASQRSEGRVMSDATLVAAWIDSWARDDLEVASWSGASAAAEPAPVLPPAHVAPRDVSTVTTPARHSVLDTASIAAAYELAWTNDSTSWTGVGVAGCVRVGALCLGGRIHAAFQSNVIVNATAAARSDLSALATASLPVTAGQTIIEPELGVGLGRLATRRLEGCLPPPPSCDPLDPTCPAMPSPRRRRIPPRRSARWVPMAPRPMGRSTSAMASITRRIRRGSPSRCASRCRCSRTSGSMGSPPCPMRRSATARRSSRPRCPRP